MKGKKMKRTELSIKTPIEQFTEDLQTAMLKYETAMRSESIKRGIQARKQKLEEKKIK